MFRVFGGSRVAVVAGEEEEEADGKRKISTQVRDNTPKNQRGTGRGGRLFTSFVHFSSKCGGHDRDPNVL